MVRLNPVTPTDHTAEEIDNDKEVIKSQIYYKIVTLCFDSLAIRLRSKDLKHLMLTPGFKGWHFLQSK